METTPDLVERILGILKGAGYARLGTPPRSLRLKNKATVPFEDGRHVWRYRVAATDVWLERPTFDGLVALVGQHCAANDLPGVTGAEVEAQICARLPERSF